MAKRRDIPSEFAAEVLRLTDNGRLMIETAIDVLTRDGAEDRDRLAASKMLKDWGVGKDAQLVHHTVETTAKVDLRALSDEQLRYIASLTDNGPPTLSTDDIREAARAQARALGHEVDEPDEPE